jgi:hypothetical protein
VVAEGAGLYLDYSKNRITDDQRVDPPLPRDALII